MKAKLFDITTSPQAVAGASNHTHKHLGTSKDSSLQLKNKNLNKHGTKREKKVTMN